MGQRKTARVSKDPDIRKQEILDKAAELFTTRGISKTSIHDIADAVGIAKGLVYYYFPSKEDLVSRMVERLSLEVDQSISRLLSQPDLDFYGRLSAIIAFYFRAIPSEPSIYSLTPGDPGVLVLVRDQLSGIALKHARQLIREGLEQSLIQVEYPDHMLRILINGLADLYLDGVTEPHIHAALVEQALGIEKGRLRLEA